MISDEEQQTLTQIEEGLSDIALKMAVISDMIAGAKGVVYKGMTAAEDDE